MSPALIEILLSRFNPYQQPGIAARYSLDGAPGDASYLIDGSNRISLIADRSGNSVLNGLVLNGLAGNYASAPSIAAYNLGNTFSLLWDGILVDWTPSAVNTLGPSRYTATGNQRSYQLNVGTDGKLSVIVSSDGTSGNTTSLTSSVAPTVADGARLAVRADWDATGAACTFYTAPTINGPWTQLGTTVTGTPRAPFAATAVMEVGSVAGGTLAVFNGACFRARVINGTFSGGTVVYDANFAALAKLATSFTESSTNAATVTINSSGDLGARISGARDLVQLTQAKQPIFSVSGGYNLGTFDGSNDYVKSAPFPLAQPETLYWAGTMVTWVNSTPMVDGNSATERMSLDQAASTPGLALYAGSFSAPNSVTGLTVGVRGMVAAVFNGPASQISVKLGAPTTGNPGTNAANGITIGGYAPGTGPWSNIQLNELIVRNVADSPQMIRNHANFLMRKWGIAA